MVTKTLPNGVSEVYDYDDANQLTSITYKQGVVILGDLIYRYDNAGQRIKISGSYARQTMPLTQTTTAYNAANQLTNWNGISQSYDLNGNLINDGAKTYSWNARNQLIALVGGGITASFQYDAAGCRVGKTINGVTTNFLYDGLNVIQELTGATPKANLLPGLNLDEVFARTEGVNTSYYLTDALNSTLALTDATGAMQTEYTYEPFGKMTQSGAANDSAYQYTGRENDGTGLMYYRARYYNSATQRFISSDPIGLAGGVNTYSYVLNSPLNWVDPLGLASTKINGNRIQVHKKDLDKWPSDPHGHIYDKNQVVDIDGRIYDKATKTEVGKLPKKALASWLDFLKSIGKLSFVGDLLFFKELIENVCASADPVSPICIPQPQACPDS